MIVFIDIGYFLLEAALLTLYSNHSKWKFIFGRMSDVRFAM